MSISSRHASGPRRTFGTNDSAIIVTSDLLCFSITINNPVSDIWFYLTFHLDFFNHQSIILTIHSVLSATSKRSVRPVSKTPLSAIFQRLALRVIDTHHPALMHILVNLGQVLELLEYEFALDFAQCGELNG
jgi:hypothetical protein